MQSRFMESISNEINNGYDEKNKEIEEQILLKI